MDMQFEEILQHLSVPNYDNGRRFVVRDRLDAISRILENTSYKKVNDTGLFELYALNGEMPSKAVLVSTHIDCVRAITNCFARDFGNGFLLGTFDNLITNAVILSLMLQGGLREKVIVAFTGDEEQDACGACQVTEFLRSRGCEFNTVILDVTDMGWAQNALFSVENNFWNDEMGRAVVRVCEESRHKWVFVPSDVDDIPSYVPCSCLIPEEALCDESWEYDEGDVQCFSLCIPTEGEMHNNSGLLVRKEAVEAYSTVLREILSCLSDTKFQ